MACQSDSVNSGLGSQVTWGPGGKDSFVSTWLGSSLPTCFSLCCDSWSQRWGRGHGQGPQKCLLPRGWLQGLPRGTCQEHNQLASCQSRVHRAAALELDIKRKTVSGKVGKHHAQQACTPP